MAKGRLAPLICCLGCRRTCFGIRWTVPERTLQQRGLSATYETQIGPASSYRLCVLTDLGNGQSQPSSEDSVRAPAGGPAGPNQKMSCCKGVPIIRRCTLPTYQTSSPTRLNLVFSPHSYASWSCRTTATAHPADVFDCSSLGRRHLSRKLFAGGSACSKWSISCDAMHSATPV
ncbi:hypothetical protein IG631_16271 [Alternaria alternata]|jgi:hypothetical protein|nr:hypothetical protein IG631_16271 [Alternaria alternata]